MTVPFNFATQSGNIPLSELDANFANVSAHATTATFVTGNNQSNITGVGTLNSLSVYGNVTAGNVSTNGIVRANAVIGVNHTGTNVSVTGNITGNNLVINGTLVLANVSTTGNVTGGNLVTAGLITAVGNINGGNVNTVNLAVNRIFSDDSTYVTVDDGLEIHGDLISESLGVAGNAVINNLTVTGNFIGTDITVNSIKNGSSNVDITNTNGNVTIGVNGTSNVLVVTSTGADVAGNISGYNLVINTIASDDSTAVSVLDDLSVHGDIDTIGGISATGNVTGGNLVIPNGGKITGDFGTSVAGGRTVFQSSVTNGATLLTAVPNGVNTNAGLVAYNSSNTVNYVTGAVIANTTAISIRSSNIGNTSPLPIVVEIGNVVRATFDVNGNVGIGNATPLDTLSVGGNAYVSGNITGGNISATNLVINHISSDDSTYVFVDDGIEVHGDILADGEISAGGSVNGSKVTTLPTALANLTAVSGARAFINNANLVASGNFGTLVGSGGSNVVPVWSDGSDWYIG